MEPVPDVTKNFSLVVQHERRFNSNVLVANIRNVSPLTHTNNTTYSLCDKLGHTENVCFKKNGFPNQDNKGPKFGNGKRFCTYCNRTGHTIDICYKKHGYPPRYKAQYGKAPQLKNITTAIQEESSKNQDQNKQNSGGDFRITQHQYKILFDLLKNVSSSNNQVQVN